MKLEKTSIKYHENYYDAVKVTLDENEATPNTPSGMGMLFADIQLWFDIIGGDRIEPNELEEPKDKEGEEVDGKVYYYDLSPMYYCEGKMSREKFEKFVLNTID